ncbi:hypothetical protein D3C72_2488540 [compost metagenome]
MATLALAHRKAFGVATPHGNHTFRHQRVMHNHIGFHQHAMRTQGQQIFCTRTSTDQPDITSSILRFCD